MSEAFTPWSMFFFPAFGPMVRSSMMYTGATSEPARRVAASFFAREMGSTPVIWKRSAKRPWMVAELTTVSRFSTVVTGLPLASFW